jgi:hypothetical protein
LSVCAVVAREEEAKMPPFVLLFSEFEAFYNLFHPTGMPFLVAITAILVGGVIAVSKMIIRHRERMAMIERGMHPDEKREKPADIPREFDRS